MIATWTLFLKETRRFTKVAFQTLAAPILTSLLYLLIFGRVFQDQVQVEKIYGDINYGQFIVPGLVMMAVLQNAFANSSSSLIQSKVMGNLIFLMLSPFRPIQIYMAYVAAAMVRGVLVGLGVLVTACFFVDVSVTSWPWLIAFWLLSAALLGALGLLAGIWAEKFDQLSAFQNFIIMPATFLSGVFYSIHSLTPFWATVSRFNPFFYMIDGFRYGFFGSSDASPVYSFWFISATLIVVSLLVIGLLKRGFHMKA